MRPNNLNSGIFLDSGDPQETKQTLDLLGFLDGQTTNPSLFAKNPEVQERLNKGEKFTRSEIYAFYKEIIKEISQQIPSGSVSIEVYADAETTVDEMIAQSKEMFSWIPNAHIKLPVTSEGLKAAESLVRDGVRVNMTLCFSQGQAAAVYAATKDAEKGQVFLSPFVGRLDDRGENGMDSIKNTIEMYKSGDGHVEVLVASLRTLDHLLYSLQMKADLATVPFKILQEWKEKDLLVPGEDWQYEPVFDPEAQTRRGHLKPIDYEEIDLDKSWQEYDTQHELTDKGLEKFAADWNNLIAG